jgi:hypothetical protein
MYSAAKLVWGCGMYVTRTDDRMTQQIDHICDNITKSSAPPAIGSANRQTFCNSIAESLNIPNDAHDNTGTNRNNHHRRTSKPLERYKA